MSESTSTFCKYQHIERLGTTEVDGILEGTCYVFPKIDGANSSAWWDAGVQCGSRRRHLELGGDNAGFHEWIQNSEESNCIGLILRSHPNLRLFGEWLVPHSLRTYRDNAWCRFYVFDVVDRMTDDEDVFHVPYDEYQPWLEEFGVDYIPCMAVVENALGYDFTQLLPQNDFLMQPDCVGEGIVIKNYTFRNRYGRQTWAKIVSSEFKEKNQKTMGPTPKTDESVVELKIVDEYVTQALCEKVKAAIEVERGDWTSKYIPRLLDTVFHDVVQEEIWSILKKHKNPTIDFKKLKSAVSMQIKAKMPEVF